MSAPDKGANKTGGAVVAVPHHFTGFLNDLSPEQERCVSEMRVRLHDKINHPRYDTVFLLRFLRARKFDLEKAIEMLTKYILWRAEFNVDSKVALGVFPEQIQIRTFYPHGYHGVSKDGRPVYIERLGAIDINKLLKDVPLERLLEYWVQDYERLLDIRFPSCSIKAKKSITQSFTVLDLDGFGFSHFSGKTRNIIKQLTQICQDYYPESLGNMVIVNAPLFFKTVWTFVKPLLDEKTTSKIQMFGYSPEKFRPVILEYVDADQLPDWLGGTGKYSNPLEWMEWNGGPWSDPEVLLELKQQRPHTPDSLLPASVVQRVAEIGSN